MTSFSLTGSNLQEDKQIYNYRHSRARRMSENGFGILSTPWRIFKGPIDATPEHVAVITKACIALHNYLASTDFRNTAATRYIPPYSIDYGSSSGDNVTAQWRDNNMQGVNRVSSNMASCQAFAIRDKFKEYFISETGKSPWQENVVRRGKRH